MVRSEGLLMASPGRSKLVKLVVDADVRFALDEFIRCA